MRTIPSALHAVLGGQRSTSANYSDYSFKSFQQYAYRSLGIDGSLLSTPSQDSSSSSSSHIDDDSSSSIGSSNSAADPGSFLRQVGGMDLGVDPSTLLLLELSMDMQEEGSLEDGGTKERAPNRWGYIFGNWMKSPYYLQYLHPNVIDRTYEESLDKHSGFRSHFRVPLVLVDELTDLFITRGWIVPMKRQRNNPYSFRIRTQLLIMASLEHLGTRKPFRQFKVVTSLSATEHQKFTKKFISKISSNMSEWISYPSTLEGLRDVMDQYEKQLLPGCVGSIDVVHVKWSACPAGDTVKAKGKEKFTTVAFEVISDNNRKVLGVAPVQFGTRNDQHIVRLDPTVKKLRDDWYGDVEWHLYDVDGNVVTCKGVYLICDGGYLRWKTLVCPFPSESHSSRNGYFSDNLESVRKDVECTFGILKARWRILEFGKKTAMTVMTIHLTNPVLRNLIGLHYRDIQRCGDVFNTCCCLHNMMLEFGDAKTRVHRVGWGAPLLGDAIYLEGPEDSYRRRSSDIVTSAYLRRKENAEAKEWRERRSLLSNHLYFMKKVLPRRQS